MKKELRSRPIMNKTKKLLENKFVNLLKLCHMRIRGSSILIRGNPTNDVECREAGKRSQVHLDEMILGDQKSTLLETSFVINIVRS